MHRCSKSTRVGSPYPPLHLSCRTWLLEFTSAPWDGNRAPRTRIASRRMMTRMSRKGELPAVGSTFAPLISIAVMPNATGPPINKHKIRISKTGTSGDGPLPLLFFPCIVWTIWTFFFYYSGKYDLSFPLPVHSAHEVRYMTHMRYMMCPEFQSLNVSAYDSWVHKSSMINQHCVAVMPIFELIQVPEFKSFIKLDTFKSPRIQAVDGKSQVFSRFCCPEVWGRKATG